MHESTAQSPTREPKVGAREGEIKGARGRESEEEWTMGKGARERNNRQTDFQTDRKARGHTCARGRYLLNSTESKRGRQGRGKQSG